MSAAHAGNVDRSGATTARTVARALLADSDERVRAQAAWTLGTIGTADDVARLFAMARGDDDDTAIDATAATARVLARARDPRTASADLCTLAANPRVLVRTNALAGLALSGARCGDGAAERRALSEDPSELVRASAALAVASAPGPDDARALGRCARVDSSTEVARRCSEAPTRPTRTHATLAYVVPAGAELPRPGAAYAMRLADGLVRAGAADRRGAVFDPVAPEGQLRLVPIARVSR